MGNNLGSEILSGISWIAVARIADQIARFIISVILARLLLPEDFGTIGMVMVFVGFAVWIGDAGFGAAIIQRKEVTEQHLQAVFWLNIGMGFILFLITFISAPFISQFYKLPSLLSLTRVISLSFLISSFGMVPYALLQRRMNFKTVAIVRIISTVISGIVGICCALYGFGVWSLVVQMFTNLFITSVMNIYFVDWYPRFKFSLQAIRDLWHYSINLFGYNTFNYWAKNVDNLLIGRIFGAEWLGYYNRTYALMLLPIFQGVNVITQVMFPALSTIQEDHHRVKRIYLRALSIISLIVCPIMFGLAIVAEPFILTVYGKNWIPMASLLQILAPVGMLQSFSIGSWIYMSQGRTDWMFRWGVVRAIIFIISILVGIVLGSVQSVVLSYAIANLLVFYPDTMIPGHLINMRFSEAVHAIFGPFIGALVMIAVVSLVKYIIPPYWNTIVELTVMVSVGILVYTVFVLLTQPPGFQEMRILFEKRFRKVQSKKSSNQDGI